MSTFQVETFEPDDGEEGAEEVVASCVEKDVEPFAAPDSNIVVVVVGVVVAATEL